MDLNDFSCCPFKTSPGRIFGGWTNCIHGLLGQRQSLLKKLEKIEDQITKLQMEKRNK